MGGARPFTVARALWLAAAVLAALGVLIGLSHVGHNVFSTCTGTWRVVVGTPDDAAGAPTDASRAASFAPSPCASSAKVGGRYEAFFQFDTQAEAQAYADQLIAAGYAKRWSFTPYVQEAAASG